MPPRATNDQVDVFVETFFATYKYLEADDTEVRGWHDEKTAWRVIEAARKRRKPR